MKSLLTLLAFVLNLSLYAQPGANDRTFNTTDIGFGNGSGFSATTPYCTAIQGDGKIIAGGDFTGYNNNIRYNIVRINTNGSLDTTFNPGNVLINLYVYAVALQSDGKIVVGGEFRAFNGIARYHIARLNTNGSLDTTFNPGIGVDSTVYTIAIQNNGQIIVGGEFRTFNGTARNGIVRINADGSIDSTFNPGTGTGTVRGNYIKTITLQPDGKIIVGGLFTTFNGTTKNRIARLNSNGTIDATFNTGTGANSSVLSTAIQSDGKIIIGGFFNSFNGTTRNYVTRLNTDGMLDTTFNIGFGTNSSVDLIAIQLDGKIVIGGQFTNYNGYIRNRVARLNADGTIDATFIIGTGLNASCKTTAIQSDGKIVVGGIFNTFNGTTQIRITRLNTNGTIDSTFNRSTGANRGVHTTAIQSDGKIIIGGSFTAFNGTTRNRIARLNTDGTLDATFNPSAGANNSINDIAIQSDGKIVIVGNFTTYNGTARNGIARLNINGTLDATFNPGTGVNDFVYDVAIQSDGNIILGGLFTTFNGTPQNRIARLNTFGSLDATFVTGSGPNNGVHIIDIQSDGKIVIEGSFSSYNGTTRWRIARLNTNGTIDATFNAGVGPNNNGISALTLQSDGKIVVGGDFTTFNGRAINRVARLNTDGSVDTTFNPGAGPDNSILAAAVQSDGKIIICGNFITCNSTPRIRIARLNSDGGLDSIFNPGRGGDAQIVTIALQNDGKIVVGGELTSYSGVGRNRVARVLVNMPIPCTDSTNTTDTINPISCSSYTSPSGNYTWTTSGTFFDTITNVGGCDSIITINLTIKQPSIGTINQSICPGQSYFFNGVNRTVQGVYLDTLLNAVGCDSILTLNLTVKAKTTGSFSQSICQGQSYFFNGVNRTVQGVYLDTLLNAVGCDSILTLNLTVKANTTGSFSQSICQGQSCFFNGANRTVQGTYTDTLLNTAGCDSIVTLNLFVKQPTASTQNKTICSGSSYSFNGQNLTLAGTYFDTLANSAGCDSFVTLILSLNRFVYGSFNASICNGESYFYNGQSLTNSGVYKDTLLSPLGCDSIVTLNLTVKNNSSSSLNQAICAGSSFSFNGQNLTIGGTYLDTLINSSGCDSIVTLTLSVNSLPMPTISRNGDTLQTQTFTTYQWLFNNTIISGETNHNIKISQNGNYSVVVTNVYNCSDTSVLFSVTGVGIEKPGESFGVKLYPNPNNGSFTVEFADQVAREIEITDALGRVIVAATKVEKKEHFYIGEHAAGIYFLNIRQGKQIKRLKLNVYE